MKVDVYYAEICGLCHKALDFFRAQDVELTTYEVHWDGERFVDSPNAIAMRERCGEVDFVPQIFIGNRHIAGWRQLEPMIESGEIHRLLEA